MKEDEKRFLIDIYNRCHNGYLKKDGISVKELIQEDGFYMHEKRAWYLLGKWSRKGLYEYGVSVRVGWLTPEGIERAKELIGESEEKVCEKSTGQPEDRSRSVNQHVRVGRRESNTRCT